MSKSDHVHCVLCNEPIDVRDAWEIQICRPPGKIIEIMGPFCPKHGGEIHGDIVRARYNVRPLSLPDCGQPLQRGIEPRPLSEEA